MFVQLPNMHVPLHAASGGPLSRMGGGKNGGRGGGGGFFGMAKANVTNVDKNAKDKVQWNLGCIENFRDVWFHWSSCVFMSCLSCPNLLLDASGCSLPVLMQN